MFEKNVKHRANDASNDVIAHPYPYEEQFGPVNRVGCTKFHATVPLMCHLSCCATDGWTHSDPWPESCQLENIS